MEYKFSQECFNKTYGSKFTHKTNVRYNLFPFTGSTSDKILDSFDNILGAFFRNLYLVEQPDSISRSGIISEICNEIECDDESKAALKKIIRDIYFVDESTLKCASVNTYKYTTSTKNDGKIAEYIVSVLCENERIIDALKKKLNSSGNVLDNLIENTLPVLSPKKTGKEYIAFFPQIRELFTKDMIYLIRDDNTDFNDMIQLISYYYFFYTSQVIIYLNNFFEAKAEVQKVYFCMGWEKTSQSRSCAQKGWHQIESKLDTMFSHAALLELLNQVESDKTYSYLDLKKEYDSLATDDKNMMFNMILSLKDEYRTVYAEPEGFSYTEDNYKDGDFESLIQGFFDDIMTQFNLSVRHRANEAYSNSFKAFCRNNFLQNRKKNGLILVLTEEQLVLLTKIIIADAKQMRLNKLFDEFEARGIFMDSTTKQCVVEFYERLNLIEKKSDSGDAQYVKGIL